MKHQDLRDVLARQQVERILPPCGFWTKCAVLLGFSLAAWLLVLLILGGVSFWLDALVEWMA